MTSNSTTGLVDKLIGGAVWAVSIADHHSDVLTPRQIEQLYTFSDAGREAATLLSTQETTIAELVAAFQIADEIACGAIENGYYVGEGLLEQLASARRITKSRRAP